jgi:gliding motility-associated-like protein
MIGATTTFYVSEVGVNGCESARTPVTITVTPADAITATASNTTNLCINTPVNLSVTQTGTNNTYLYTWTATPQAGSGTAVTGTPGTSPAPTAITPTVAGMITYTVMGNQNGPAIYSNLTAGSAADEDLGNITISQGATTVLNNTTPIVSLVGTIGTATGIAGRRSDFTAFGPYTLNANGTYNLSLTTINQGFNYGHGIKVFIDYNRNGSFADAGETVYASPSLIAPPHTETGSFTVPATALSGLTRLRVIVNEGTIATPESAPTWGEVEEYAINLVTPNVGGGDPSTGCTVYSSVNVNVIDPWVGITASVTPATANICGLGTPVSLTGTAGGPATLPTGYAASAATSTADEEILNVSLGTAGSLLNNTSSCANTGGPAGNGLPASILNRYSNFTTVATVPVPSIAPGATVPYALTLGYCGTFAYTNLAKIYIDYNRNGIFETTEQAATTTYVARAITGSVVTGTFTVPTTASPGRTLMRVVYVESSVVNPTGTYSWGETEDYAVTIGTTAASQEWTEGTTTLGTASTLAYTPTSFGTKTITYTAADANGCKISANATLNVSQPVAPTVANVTLCQNSTATALTATALTGHTVKWYTTATGGTALASAPIPSTATAGTTTYYATQTTPQGCESLRAPLDVIVNPAPALTSAATIAPVCNQTAITYTPTASIAGTTLAWSRAAVTGISNAAGTGTNAINENLNNTTANPVTVTYVYNMTVTATGCTGTSNVTATVNPAATLTSATSAPAICNNTAFAYTPTSATAGTTYAWSRAAVTGITNAAANGTGAINETLINTTANPITVTYNYVLTANGCSNNQSVTVVVNPSATMSSALTANVCSGRLFKYTPLSATAGTTYAWSRAAVTGITNTAATGTGAISETLTNSTQAPINVTYVYTLTSSGCTNTQNLVVTVNPTPAKLIITADGPTVFCKEESVVLRFNPTNTGTYQWYQDGVPVSGATATNTTVYTAGSFTAIVTNSYGCASDPSTAMLVEVPCEIGISLPDIFTPNGDGSNDKIKPIVPGIHTFSFFRVYNRWGNLVFESTDPDAAWDGSYKGEMQPQDSYSYVIEGYNFRMELIRKQGTITLVR